MTSRDATNSTCAWAEALPPGTLEPMQTSHTCALSSLSQKSAWGQLLSPQPPRSAALQQPTSAQTLCAKTWVKIQVQANHPSLWSK